MGIILTNSWSFCAILGLILGRISTHAAFHCPPQSLQHFRSAADEMQPCSATLVLKYLQVGISWYLGHSALRGMFHFRFSTIFPLRRITLWYCPFQKCSLTKTNLGRKNKSAARCKLTTVAHQLIE